MAKNTDVSLNHLKIRSQQKNENGMKRLQHCIFVYLFCRDFAGMRREKEATNGYGRIHYKPVILALVLE